MLSAIFLINQKGEIIIFRLYRDDVSLTAANTFRLSVIASKETGSEPVRLIDGNTFMYIRHKDMFFVAVTRTNSNAGELGTRVPLYHPLPSPVPPRPPSTHHSLAPHPPTPPPPPLS